MANEGQYWSGQVNFTGLGNGTDFGKIVDGLTQKAGFHKRRLERWKTGWQDKSKELLNLNTTVLNLQTVLKKMDSMGEFMGKTVTSADTSVVTVSATGDASFGSHKVQVKQLATTDHWTSSGAGYAKLDSPVTVSNGAFSFSYGGKSVTLNVPKKTSLQQFIANINNHPKLSGKVRASAVNDGSNYFLQLKGLDLGASNSIVLSNSTIPGLQTSAFTNIQKAQDALLKVDGFPPGKDAWMRRKTNSVNDAIEGVTLNLKSTKPNSVIDVTISQNFEETKKTVKEFLNAMNAVRTQIGKLTEVTKGDKDKAKGSILTGNYGVEMVSQQLKLATASAAVGFEFSGQQSDIYSALSQIGITTDAKKGSATFRHLKINDSVFDKALKENPQAVAALFVTDHSISSTSTDFTPGTIVKGVTKPGKHAISYSVSGGKIVSASINGNAAKISGWEITGTSGKDAAGLSLTVTNQADGSYTGQINVRLGKIHELLEDVSELTNPNTGTLKVIEKNYATIISNIDKKIERETKRINNKKRHLKNRFSRLDATLGRYEKLQGTLKAQIAKLGK